MTGSTVYSVVLGPISAEYKILKDGEPVYETWFAANELEFRPPGEDDPVLELKAPTAFDFLSGMEYRLTDLETDEIVGDISEEAVLIGRRWTIKSADGEKRGIIRMKGKKGALMHEIAALRFFTGPMQMEIVDGTERRVGTIDRTVGVHDRITVSVDDDADFDPRLAMAAAILFDAADRRKNRHGRGIARSLGGRK